MPPRSKTATKVAVSAQTKILVAVVSIVAFGLAAVGYGYGFGFGSIRPTSLTTTRRATKTDRKTYRKTACCKFRRWSSADRPTCMADIYQTTSVLNDTGKYGRGSL